jgi:hypothetical protein
MLRLVAIGVVVASTLCGVLVSGAAGNTAKAALDVAAQPGAVGGWSPIQQLGGVSNGTVPGVTALSCPATGDCVAAGTVADGTGTGIYVAAESGGNWGSARELAGAGVVDFTAGKSGTAVNALSCAADGDCVLGGTYEDASGDYHAIVAGEQSGKWTSATEVPGSAALNAGGKAQVTSVSCTGPQDCAVGGWYTDGGFKQQAFVVGETNGVWGNAAEVPGTAALNTLGKAAVTSLSCTAPGNCAAVGWYSDSTTGRQAMIVTESGGTWGNARQAPGTAPLNTQDWAELDSVSCSAAGACAAVGWYATRVGETSGDAGLVIDESGGTWGAAQPVSGNIQLNRVSCASPGNCGASGILLDSANAYQAITINETKGGWGVPAQVPGIAARNAGGYATADAVSCPAAGECAVGGTFTPDPGGGTSSGFVAQESGGAWGSGLTFPAGSAALGPAAWVYTLSCTAPDACVAGGVTASGYSFVAALSPGCTTITRADGDYEFGGCVTAADAGHADVTSAMSNLDGLDISASATDEVTYGLGGAAGYTVTSAGTSTMSLKLGSALTRIFTGRLSESLTKPVTVSVPAKTVLAGLPLSGTLTITPKAGGTADGKGTVTLPPVLGGGKATLSFTTTVNKGLSSVSVTVNKASWIQLFGLTKLTLEYQAGPGGTETWNVTATASSGGGKTAPLTGSLTYSGGKLTAASLHVGSITLAGGLATLTKLTVNYNGATWSGSGTVYAALQKRTIPVAVKLAFGTTGLTAGLITAANFPLFGVLELATFRLSYDSGAWRLTATAPGGGGADGMLSMTGGTVSTASLTITKVSFLGRFLVDSASVGYARQAPNAACKTVPGSEIWCGAWQVVLPSAKVVTGVRGELAVADGAFASGSITVKGNVPLLDGLYLTQLGGSVTISPPPVTIAGTAAVRFGPKIKGTSLLAFEGTLTRKLPGSGTSGGYAMAGTVSAFGKLTGKAHVTVPGDGAATTITLTADATVGKASATGTLTGSFTAGTLVLSGAVSIHVLGHTVAGSLKADALGMAACGSYKGKQAGFEYLWSGRVTFLGTAGCSAKGF